MITLGARELINKFGSSLGVAEALLEGKLGNYEQQFVTEIVNNLILEAAKFRVETRLKERQKEYEAALADNRWGWLDDLFECRDDESAFGAAHRIIEERNTYKKIAEKKNLKINKEIFKGLIGAWEIVYEKIWDMNPDNSDEILKQMGIMNAKFGIAKELMNK